MRTSRPSQLDCTERRMSSSGPPVRSSDVHGLLPATAQCISETTDHAAQSDGGEAITGEDSGGTEESKHRVTWSDAGDRLWTSGHSVVVSLSRSFA